ncbi:TetR/AcrR family transcriptional regulator [Nocardia panacis]|uniref:TetR/AcrR family transcriptional regulator n=1 Tax=Nocardia panacis TaxID=2340916 RepID=A0A3A4K4J6_9NOCA|nr:TetR/AcrR family transcriptional regulator [Nocardia panacis]RJO69174.1 TetR/AcrR family transcriptional regulator [Nocardia panacis]
MARPRGFDEEQAVEAAMRAFWACGYEGTSTQDLCAATGLGRSSIYNAFAGKHDLYERALRRYMETKNAGVFSVLDGDGTAKEKVRELLDRAIEWPATDPSGCLVVNTMVELGPRDEAVAATLRSDLEQRLGALTATLRAGQLAGEIENRRDARDLAHFVVATISGMRVAARGGADRAALTAIAETALDCL